MTGFSLAWHQHGDRYFYSVAWGLGDVRVDPVLRTVEDSQAFGDEIGSLVGPPLQQVHRSSDRVWLAVGMAGKNHWSLSIEVSVDTVIFDVACRLREPTPLGSLFETDWPNLAWKPDGPNASARYGDRLFRLQPDSAVCRIDKQHLVLAVSEPVSVLPTTVRWKYSLGCGDPAPQGP